MFYPSDELAEAPVRLQSNRARKGDADYRAPLPTPGHGLPKAPKAKKAPAARAAGTDAQGHAHGTGAQGGQFVSKGASGGTVRTIQKRVGAKVDGAFGDQTARAVRAFQKRHGLQVDGVVGRQTALAFGGRYREAKAAKPGALTGRSRGLITRARSGARSGARTAPRPGRAAGGILVADLDLYAAGEDQLLERDLTLHFDEYVHPRDWRGRWVDKVAGLTPRGQAGPSVASLPDGTRITAHRQGGYAVHRSGRIVRHAAPGAAIDDALNRSARGREPESYGGPQRHRSAEAAFAAGRGAGQPGQSPPLGDQHPSEMSGLADRIQWHELSADRLRVHANRPEGDPRRFAARNQLEIRARGDGTQAAAARTVLRGLTGGNPDPRSVAAAAEGGDPRPQGRLTPNDWNARLSGMSVGQRLPVSRNHSLNRTVLVRAVHNPPFRLEITNPEGELVPGAWMNQSEAADLLFRRRYQHAGAAGVGPGIESFASSEPAWPSDPREQGRRHRASSGHSPVADSGWRQRVEDLPITPGRAVPGELTVRGNVFGRDATLHLRRQGSDLVTRDPVGLASTRTGDARYPRHLRFAPLDGAGYMPRRQPQIEVDGQRYVLQQRDVARNRPAAVTGLHPLAGEASRSGRNRDFGSAPLRPGEGLDTPGGLEGSAAAPVPARDVAGEQAARASGSASARAVALAVGRIAPGSLGGSTTSFESVEVHGDHTYVRGNDGRVWSIRNAALGRNLTNADVQVRLQSGEAYSSPAFGRELARVTGRRWEGHSQSSTLSAREAHPAAGAASSTPRAGDVGPSPSLSATPRGGVDVGPVPTGGGPKLQQVVTRLHGFSSDGLTTQITGVSARGFSGTILDENGRRVGGFSRSEYSPEEIHHSLFTISESHRDSGFGSKLINRMFDAYKDAGYKKVSVDAGLSVGGYQWAKMGFDIEGGEESFKSYVNYDLRHKFEQAVREDRVPQLFVDELRRQVEEGVITRMSQLAAWGRRHTWEETRDGKTIRMHLGKYLMLGSGWSGEYDLSKHVSGQAIRAR